MNGNKAPTGTSCVIIGNGSSLDLIDQSFWAKIKADPETLLIGTNRVLCFKSFQDVIFDTVVIRDSYRSLWLDQKWGAEYHLNYWKKTPEETWTVGNGSSALTRCTHVDQFVTFKPGFQSEIVHSDKMMCVATNPSVVIMAMNYAYLMGCKNQYLVGVDYCGKHAEMVKPYNNIDTGWSGLYQQPVPKKIEDAFRVTREAIKAGGGSVFNISPKTKLRSIAKRKWENVYK